MRHSHQSSESYQVVIDSGIPIKYIQDYFKSNAEALTPYHYIGSNWEVILIPKASEFTNRKTAINIPRTEIQFLGEKAQVDQIVSAYRLEFLSAGG